MAHMPTPHLQVVAPKTAVAMLPLTHVLITKGRAGTNEKKRRERKEVKSAMMTSIRRMTMV